VKTRSTCSNFALLSPLSSIYHSYLSGKVTVGECSLIEYATIRATHSIEIGKHCYVGEGARLISDLNPIIIENYTQIAAGVQILESNHNQKAPILYNIKSALFQKPFFEGLTSKGAIILEHDVWIGASSIVLSGVTIGHGSIVGAGSVVTKSIPPYSIVCGNPAKVIRTRFDQEICNKIDATRWWELSKDGLELILPQLHELTSTSPY